MNLLRGFVKCVFGAERKIKICAQFKSYPLQIIGAVKILTAPIFIINKLYNLISS